MNDRFYNPGPDDEIEPVLIPPPKGGMVTDRYEQVDTGPPGAFPLFRVVHGPRSPTQTDEQHKVSRRWTEEYFLRLSVARALAHDAATGLGFHETCRRPACRRRHACAADKRENDWSFPGPWMPPCGRTARLVDAIRKRMCEDVAAMGEGRGAEE